MKLYNTLIVLILLPAIALAVPIDKFNKTKSIKQSYNVNSDALVDIENSFGDVTIETWDKNIVSIEVYVEVSGNDENIVDEKLREVDVTFNASSSRVSAETYIPSTSSGVWNWWKASKNANIQVNYLVKIPVASPLELSNDYGAVIIEKLSAPTDISCDFGRLQIGQLLHTDNKLSFDYTDNSNIDYVKEAIIKADFSNFRIYGADNLDFSGDYTKAKLPQIKNLKYNSDFSTINVEGVDNVDGRGDYSNVSIDYIKESGDFNADFGTVNIGKAMNGFKMIDVKSDYTTVKIGYDPAAAFTYELDTEFGSLKVNSSLTTTQSRSDGTEKFKEGYHLDNKSSNRITVNSSFGSVSLNPNN
ncbi:hypothetical protein [Nonlabens ponticola]|uniref:Adhesin domain-containing protein n=1 Tax=Nonlabens ponticola TaxID=2496866 RepID=A0A3S9MYR3_9FLAO|nr:hypothetical protein [Nonlabens ponticola]AZQ44289.1 hypothetical protein EJ995_08590 [Nonlabens ponticola]